MTPDQRPEVGIDLPLGHSDVPPELPGAPFCLLVIGDFGGEAPRGPLAERRPIAFDRDDVDGAVARVGPVLRPDAAGGPIRFRSLEDFHPDRLFTTLPLFAGLRDLRARLQDPRTLQTASRELASPADAGASPAARPSAGVSLLEQVVAESAGEDVTSYASRSDAPTGTAADDLADFIRQVVREHLVADPDPRQAELVRGTDRAVTAQMRALLHEPSFRALESAWRTVDRLARRVETSTSLRLYLLDVSSSELDVALNDEPAGAGSELARALARSAAKLPDGGRWSVLVVLRSFGEDELEHARLARLGIIARSLAAPAFVDAAPSFAGLESWAEAREHRSIVARESPTLAALRASPAAAWLLAAAPRVLLREPYGREGEPVETFDFAELGENASHEGYLWGSGGAVCALLLAQAFEQSGWELRPGQVRDLDGLPMHMRRGNGETEIVPCAETTLTETAAERLLELGITPITTMRGTDTAHVVRFQSLASPPTALAGPWVS